MSKHLLAISLGLALVFVGCSTSPYPGPDKQFGGSLEGAATGAGAGAVTGFQLGAGAGPGAAVGAGLGAVAGGIQGMVTDTQEEQALRLSAETREERARALAHELINEHLKRRVELHPSRDIYPADLFFRGDEVSLRPEARPLVEELARMNKQRMPYSRLVVAAYVKANDSDSTYAEHLAQRRSRELSDQLIKGGLEPRRLLTRAVIIKEPLLIDPYDRPDRYNQAIELIPLDR